MNNLKAKLKKQGGFTLIEMLIVVAIIAILIAIGIPMVNTALESAREATDAANERSALGVAMVEVLSKNTLGGEEIGTAPISACYKIEATGTGTSGSSGMGELVEVDDVAVTDAFKYGKGTAAGKISGTDGDHAGKYIKITYTPASATTGGGGTTTITEDKFEISWEKAS